MATVYIFHGTGGSPQSNWIPWLQRELETLGHAVAVPAFPSPDTPDLAGWEEAFKKRFPAMQKDAILVGHSLGATFALRLLERCMKPVLGTILVAPVSQLMGNAFDPLVQSFLARPFSWKDIRRNGGAISVLTGNDDPYIPMSHMEALTQHVNGLLTIIKNGKHLNAEAGYATFPDLLKTVLATTTAH